jgi:hypothetical protein
VRFPLASDTDSPIYTSYEPGSTGRGSKLDSQKTGKYGYTESVAFISHHCDIFICQVTNYFPTVSVCKSDLHSQTQISKHADIQMFQCLTLSVCNSALLNQSDLSNKIITTIRVVVALTPHRSNAPAAIVLHRRNHQNGCTPPVEMKGFTPPVEMKGYSGNQGLTSPSGNQGVTTCRIDLLIHTTKINLTPPQKEMFR